MMRLDHFPEYAGPFGADDQPMIYPGGDRLACRIDCGGGEGDIALDPVPDIRHFLLTRLPVGNCQPPF